MTRDDCEKLLAAYRECIIAGSKTASQMLFEVIIGVMAGDTGKTGAWRDGTTPHLMKDSGVYRGGLPLTIETDVANMPSIPNMNSLLCEHEEEKCN